METIDIQGRIDLHAHTTASDGTLTPAELIRHASEIELGAIAITDHDTVDGVPEAMKAGSQTGVHVVPGVEISLAYEGPKVSGRSGWMHLLVYYIDSKGSLAGELSELQRWRAERNHRIIRKLNELGIDITLDDVAAVAGGGQLGRPHFARVLLNKGYVQVLQEAFDKYLAKGAPAYEDKRRLTAEEAIKLANECGAFPVLAHPYSLGLGKHELRQRLDDLKSMGLRGIEVIYPEHDDKYRALLTSLAKDMELSITGGTDFHGANKPEIKLGSGKAGNVNVDASYLLALRKIK